MNEEKPLTIGNRDSGVNTSTETREQLLGNERLKLEFIMLIVLRGHSLKNQAPLPLRHTSEKKQLHPHISSTPVICSKQPKNY